jgi:N utilization substance protein A
LELEVPEIHEGLVEIKGIAREAGNRSKVSVLSYDPNVDAVGACVGPRGMRIQRIVAELKGEKVDVIQWHNDPGIYVSNALSPARVILTRVDEDSHIARAIVPDNQLSLAIGKEGQNARLAAKLTGWKVDIKSDSQVRALEEEQERLAELEAQAGVDSEQELDQEPIDMTAQDDEGDEVGAYLQEDGDIIDESGEEATEEDTEDATDEGFTIDTEEEFTTHTEEDFTVGAEEALTTDKEEVAKEEVTEEEIPTGEDEVQPEPQETPEAEPQETKRRKKKDLKKKGATEEQDDSVVKRRSPKKRKQEAYETDDDWNEETDL